MQVIDLDENFLQNVITFPPQGGFFVDSAISVESEQRVQFKFSGATFKVNGRKFGVPPFGKGWCALVVALDFTERACATGRSINNAS